MIIDAWGQHPTLRHSQDPIFDSLRRWTKTQAPTEQLPVSVTVDLMDQGGIDRMLISAWSAPRNNMISNDEVADFVAEAPDRLIGVGSVDLSHPMEAVAEIRRCVRELGFKAIRVLPWLWEVPPTDRRFYPVYVACVEEGVPFCTQIGHTGPLMPSEVGRPIYLDQVALDFPDLVIVGGHIGYPGRTRRSPWQPSMRTFISTRQPTRFGDTRRPYSISCVRMEHRKFCSEPTTR